MTRLARACTRNAVSRWSILATAVILVLGALPPLPEVPSFTLPQRMAAVGVALVPSMGLLAVARVTWLAPASRLAGVATSIATFAVAGAVAGATRGWAVQVLGTEPPVSAAWRVPATALAATLWLSLLAIAVDFVREHQAAMRSLRHQEEVLRDLERDAQGELERQRARLVAPARDVLNRIIAALPGAVAGADGQPEATTIRQIVARQLRPMSHDLLLGDVQVPMPAPAPPARSGWLPRVMRAAARTMTRHPLLVAALPVVLFPLITGPRWGFAFMFLNAAATWAFLAAALSVLRRAAGGWLARQRPVVAAPALVTGYAAAAAVSTVITALIGGALGEAGAGRVIGLAFVAAVITAIFLGASAVEATAALLDADERELRTAVAQAEWSLAHLHQQARFEQQRIGRRLHGDIQGAILGAARDLEGLSASSTPEDRESAVRDASERLRAAAAVLDAPPPEDQSLEDALDGVLMLSRRALDVDISIEEEAAAAINRAPATRRVVVDVVAESLTNALRHGAARAARIDISRREPDAVVLQVVDDGTWAPPGSGTPGAGTTLYAEVSPEWSLGPSRDGGTRLDIAIPCLPAPPTTPLPS